MRVCRSGYLVIMFCGTADGLSPDEVPESSVFNHGFRYYRNPTEYEFVKDTTTGALYGPYSTFYVPDWMTEEVP